MRQMIRHVRNIIKLFARVSAGLKRRALGLFKTNSTTALIQKISKDNADADDVMRRVADIEQVSHWMIHA